MADVKGHLLPVYIVADESGSMGPHLAELNQGLASLHRALRGDPMVAAKVRLTVLGFSSKVAVRLPLADVRDLAQMPRIVVGGTTNFLAAFDDLHKRIPQDVKLLKGQGYEVHRPAVFFLTDGQPDLNQNWRASHARLIDRSATPGAPNIIACGVGAAHAPTIVDIATTNDFAFIAVRGADIGEAITEFFMQLTASVIRSGQSLGSSNPTLAFSRPDQFVMAIDVV